MTGMGTTPLTHSTLLLHGPLPAIAPWVFLEGRAPRGPGYVSVMAVSPALWCGRHTQTLNKYILSE